MDAPARWATASLWADALTHRTPATVASGRRRDVVVVGGGLAGLVTAVVLQRAGLDVLVVERHTVGGVTTRNSTAKLTALQGQLLADITERRDVDAAAAYAAASIAGVTGLRRLIDACGIECDLIDADDHTFATEDHDDDAYGVARARAVLEAAQAAGLPVTWTEETELPFPILGAVRLAGQAHLDPGKLCAGLAEAVRGGAPDALLEGAAVTGVDEQRDRVDVSLVASGVELTVAADHVVIATLGPIHDPALLTTRCEARRSYAIAVPVDSAPAAPLTGTYISVDESARSIRPATIGPDPGRRGLVVGGNGHVVAEWGGQSSAQRWDELEGYARDHLGAGPATHRWVAHDLVPSDHVPFIGRVGPGAERRWVLSGFQKWGISTAFVGADLVLGELEGRPREWAAPFDPRRMASSFTTKLLEDGARAVRHLVLDRLADLRPGRPRRPRCSHLGCVLDFDADEQTWDCACHGSRFDVDGAPVSGPARRSVDVPRRSLD